MVGDGVGVGVGVGAGVEVGVGVRIVFKSDARLSVPFLISFLYCHICIVDIHTMET